MKIMFNAHLAAARDEKDARALLQELGADPDGIEVMAPRARHLLIRLEKVPTVGANLIKKEMLGLGGEAAESSEAYEGRGEATDVLLMGTVAQHRKLAKKLTAREHGLGELGACLPGFIDAVMRDRFEVPLPKGNLSVGHRPLLMGIINCTPDSFYDGGRHFDKEAAVARGRKLIEDGADILDIGGESTRPGSEPVSVEEESTRVIPVIRELVGSGAVISIDTQKAEVARKAVEAGAAMINDVSALSDPGMAGVAADTGAALVLMHMLGTPRTMQQDPRYDNLFGEIIAFLRERMERAVEAGVSEEAIIVDPGIGFGKTFSHNLELIRDLWRLRSLGRPVLLGPSNKSFIGKVLDVGIDERAQGTGASLVAGVLSGAHILRVHDVAGMKDYVDMAWAIAGAGKNTGG